MAQILHDRRSWRSRQISTLLLSSFYLSYLSFCIVGVYWPYIRFLRLFSHGHMDHPMSVYCWKQKELPHCCVRFLYYLDVVVKYRGPNSNDKDNSVVQLTWLDLNWVCWWPSSRSHPCAGRAEALSWAAEAKPEVVTDDRVFHVSKEFWDQWSFSIFGNVWKRELRKLFGQLVYQLIT